MCHRIYFFRPFVILLTAIYEAWMQMLRNISHLALKVIASLKGIKCGLCCLSSQVLVSKYTKLSMQLREASGETR